jgi:hypothetical protein
MTGATLRFSLALLLSKAAAVATTVNLGAPATSTPYDPYMRPVKTVLRSLSGETPSMKRVCGLMREGRSFRYSFTEPYVAESPSVTASRKAGDCKAKSLWLCAQLGDQNLRYVIGKSRLGAKLSHAWVMWKADGKWWILDCTNTSRPILAESISSSEYIPLFSFDRDAAYEHAFPGTLARTSTTAKRSAIATKPAPQN